MISCLVIEDQLPARKILQKYIHDAEGLELKEMFSNAIAALEYLKENPVDLLFLDIHLPKLSGIDFLGILPQKPLVILTTAFSEYALQGYELDVVDYLLKPFSFDRFLKSVFKVERLLQKMGTPSSPENKEPESILVKVGYDRVKLNMDDISHIQADGDYTHVFCNEKKHLTSQSLKYWLEKLPKTRFYQIHRSYIVQISHVQKLSGGNAIIWEKAIPIGRLYKKEFMEVFLG